MAALNGSAATTTMKATVLKGNPGLPRSGSNRLRVCPVLGKNDFRRVCSVSASHAPPQTVAIPAGENKIGAEKLDRWMRGSVEEIVKNLRKAPLLVEVFSGEDRRPEVRAEHAVVEEWREVKGEWESGARRSPEGLIFVEELRDEEDEDEDEAALETRNNGGETKAWGIVVQGRGAECGPVCYLLKTSSVKGLGLFCTHFCLVRVNNFRDNAFCQFKNCWLLQ